MKSLLAALLAALALTAYAAPQPPVDALDIPSSSDEEKDKDKDKKDG